MLKTTLQVVTGLLISAAWVATLISGVVSHDYQGLTLTTPIMAIYAGYVFGGDVIEKMRGGKK
jgi:hypothetical protein